MTGSGSIGSRRALRDEADAAIARFFALVRAEIRRYDPAGRTSAELRRYLRPQFGPGGELSPLGVAGYSARLRPAVQAVLSGPPGLRILDAGSGFGTESLLFAWLGARVTSVELIRERHEIARGRPEVFRGAGDPPLRVDFVHANILRFLQTAPAFDLIWAMEAISHIYPPERFLALARGRLAPGGVLAVSDPNRANPVAWLRAALIRGSIRHVPHRKYSDPEMGTPVDFGQEMITSVRGMTRWLAQAGYALDTVSVGGFFGSSVLPMAWRLRRIPVGFFLGFERIIGRTPILRRLGSNYTILARPSA
jgi:SAM-dependent methyltransferase